MTAGGMTEVKNEEDKHRKGEGGARESKVVVVVDRATEERTEW